MQAGSPEKISLHQLGLEPWKKEMAAQITARVQTGLARYYPELESERNLQVALAHPPRRRRFTVIFELTVHNGASAPVKRLIAKAYRITPKPGARDQDIGRKSQREFLFHQQVYEYFCGQRRELAVVRPVDYFPDLLTLVVERAEGADLGRLIHEARYTLGSYSERKAQLGKHFERSGEWLACLHKGFPAATAARFELAQIEQQVNHYYQRLLRAGGPKKLADPIRQRILRLAGSFTGWPVQQAQLHGDFKLRHLFATDERLTAIDFGNELAGETFDDVARFLVEIKLLEYGLSLPLRRDLMRDLQDRFLLGYYGASRWQPLLRFYYLVWLWAKWDRRLKKLSTNKLVKRADRWMRATGIKRLLNHTYVNGWFQRELNAELALVEREIRSENFLTKA